MKLLYLLALVLSPCCFTSAQTFTNSVLYDFTGTLSADFYARSFVVGSNGWVTAVRLPQSAAGFGFSEVRARFVLVPPTNSALNLSRATFRCDGYREPSSFAYARLNGDACSFAYGTNSPSLQLIVRQSPFVFTADGVSHTGVDYEVVWRVPDARLTNEDPLLSLWVSFPDGTPPEERFEAYWRASAQQTAHDVARGRVNNGTNIWETTSSSGSWDVQAFRLVGVLLSPPLTMINLPYEYEFQWPNSRDVELFQLKLSTNLVVWTPAPGIPTVNRGVVYVRLPKSQLPPYAFFRLGAGF